MNIIDLYSKKTISYQHGTHKLQFKLSQELFSSLNIDHGTQRLLRTLLFENINSYRKVLDLGCGYGPIGITMKKVCPSAEVHLVDVDALALEFTRENARLNGFINPQIYASLGYDQVVDKDFDIIISNIPAKIGENAIRHLLTNAKNHLTKEGKVIIVVIDAIADFVRNQLECDESISISYRHSWPGHQVYHYQFVDGQVPAQDQKSSFNQGIFFRGSQEFENDSESYYLDVSYNLPEFDQLSFQTKLLRQLVHGVSYSVKSGMCFSVRQGYLPLLVAKHFGLDKVLLVDRDLLALKTSQHNLNNYGISADINHSVFARTKNKVDLIVGAIPEKQSQAIYAALARSFSDCLVVEGRAIVVSSSTTMARLEEFLKPDFKAIVKEKARGNTGLILQK